MKVTAIIASGGSGFRMGSALPKQFITVKDIPILAYSLITFNKCAVINEIILTTPPGYEAMTTEITELFGSDKISMIITGGKTRQQTVYKALQAAGETDIIVIHDAVRPFVTMDEIMRVIKTAQSTGACSLGVPVKDTIKICDANAISVATPARSTLWMIQTPQAFSSAIIKEAHKCAYRDGVIATDDSELADRIGYPTRIIMGDYTNIKITTKDDLSFFR